jgi:17beta-estradiol 17-dehydrogenase / very-long-chain 3-oxoacyl-CoA reductase
LIVNLSSAAAIVPSPLLSVYSASKVYVDYFSQALAGSSVPLSSSQPFFLNHLSPTAEYASSGIVVESQIPFFVVSNMSKRSRPTLFIPMPDTYVKAALSKIGNATAFCPYFWHALLA